MVAGSRDLLTLNAAYPSCQENHCRLGNVGRTHLVEFALSVDELADCDGGGDRGVQMNMIRAAVRLFERGILRAGNPAYVDR